MKTRARGEREPGNADPDDLLPRIDHLSALGSRAMRLEPVAFKFDTLRRIAEAGLLRPAMPDRLLKAGFALWRFGATPAAAAAAASARAPNARAVVDERGALTYLELHLRTNALAHALADRGLCEGENVALLCRNHRGFVEATIACSKLGANMLYLNTGFAGPQIAEVLKREQATSLIFDDEFADLVGDAGGRGGRFVAWSGDAKRDLGLPKLEDLITLGDASDVVAPRDHGRATILTSGTTGTPKGASRGSPTGLDPLGALLSKIPLRAGGVTVDAPPLFHAWGYSHFLLSMAFASTMVLRRRFDPAQALADVQEHRADTLVLVPVMLQRILGLGRRELQRYDFSSLRIVALSGSAVSAQLANEALDALGDVIYNLYGSTEVAWATIATPSDLHAAPGTAGKPPRGTVVRLFDEHGLEVSGGERGRIFVGNEMLFDGYTGGGGKDMLDGLMATGDVGHFDRAGRLFVEGRSDDMIVSGGENVFPAEIEEILSAHEKIAEAAVVGIEDPDFGQRLKAFVVRRKGAKLTEAMVKKHVKRNLATYKVPRHVEFLEELPRNSTGKVLRRELQEREGGA